MIDYYNMNKDQIFNEFKSSEYGLKKGYVMKNRKKYGSNIIKQKDKKSVARVFLEQFQDLLVILLIIAAIISIFLGELESTIVIFSVLTLNAIMGTYQYEKAEKSLNSLKNLSSPNSYVIRDNEVIKIKSYELVCGDVVILSTGDIVSADGRIIDSESLEINESSLTGESVPVSKNNKTISKTKEISERSNYVFSGTFCTRGHGKYIVCDVGSKTEIGKIAEHINRMEVKRTPLQNSLDSFSKYLAILIIGICIVVFALGIYRSESILDSLMFAVALAVAAIPEALSTIVVIVLAIGTERMAKENAIIKDLKAVESLGCISVICTDKTGTLTTNKMEVVEAKCYDSRIIFKDNIIMSTNYDTFQTINNPTEEALINYAKNSKNKDNIKISEIPFTSERKIMSNLYLKNNEYIMYTKGALDYLIERCSYINGIVLSKELKDKVINDSKVYSSKGRRIIAFAYKVINKNNISNKDEFNLNFSGFVAIIDPPRKESKNAVKKCVDAGIKPIMLTGDGIDTALAIASELGIYKDGDKVIDGKIMNKMSDAELYQEIEQITVYARLNHNQKIRIVEGWQKKNKVVAMTGDGINDALALAKADVSIAMGNGTEVAKDASSMILVDNNFNTIVKSIANGRNIYKNIQNAILFLISGNLAGIVLVLLTSFLKLPIPFLAVHLLFINLLTDSLPAISIGMEESNGSLLNEKPRKKNEGFLSKKIIFKILIEGLIISLCCILAYFKGLKEGASVARTMSFAVLCMSRLFHSLNCSTNESIFFVKKINKFLISSLIVGLILINLVLFVPFLKSIFVTAHLSKELIFAMYGYSLLPTVILQIFKINKK